MKKPSSLLFIFLGGISLSIAQPIIQWQKKFGGTGIEGARALAISPYGGFVLSGFSYSNDGDLTENNGSADYWVVKTDANGTLEWQNNLGGNFGDFSYSIICTSDGGYALTGNSSSIDGDVQNAHGGGATGDHWLVKLDGSGNIEWSSCYGGTGFDNGYAVIQTNDGGYALCGDVGSQDGDVNSTLVASPDMWLVRLDASGNILWEQAYGGASGENGFSLVETDDGDFVMAGSSQSWDSGVVTGNHGSKDFWIVKTNSVGNLIWQKSYGGAQLDVAESIVIADDGGYAIAGFTGSEDGNVTDFNGAYDFWVMKLDEDGTIVWQNCYGGFDDEKAYAIDNTTDGGFVVTGFAKSNDGDVTGNQGDHDVWVIKISADGQLQWQKSIGGSSMDDGYAIKEISSNEYVVLGSSPSMDGDASPGNGSDDFWLIRLSATSSIDESDIDEVSFYPNPFSETTQCKISSNNHKLSGATIRFMDCSGKEILLKQINGNTLQLSNSDLAQGMFFYTLIFSDGRLSHGKIIHQ